MADLLSFSDEVLCRILGSISKVKDLHNVMLVCHRFLHVIKSYNRLWKFEKKVKNMLQGLSSKYFLIGEPSLVEVENMVNSESHAPDEWMESVLQNEIFNQNLNENLTTRFYARKMLRYFRSCVIEKKLKHLMDLPESQKSILEGAVLISQWVQTEQEHLISLIEVELKLEDITKCVKQHLVEKSDTFTAKEILECINKVLYREMEFKVMQSDYSFEYFFIDKVLESRIGFPVTLCIIYREVAKRMGIYCEPVLPPKILLHRFYLKWNANPNLAGDTDCNQLIDPANGGSLHYFHPTTCPVVSTKEFLQRIVEYMRRIRLQSIRSGRREGRDRTHFQRRRNELCFSRLACAVSPDQTSSILLYAHLCLDLDVQLEDAVRLLQQVETLHDHRLMEKCIQKLNQKNSLVTKKKVIHLRSSSVKYAVGLVMIYKDSACKPPLLCVIDSWTHHDPDRIFYNVLFDDGDSSFVAEDNLKLNTNVSFVSSHPNIGLSFERFNGRRYISNAEMMTLFPDDEAFALSLVG
ncbi:F-box only protein 21-like isoform X1 [Daphnia pulex]|uniref:F-box only protein 21-like isoform X1 n=3 Tax=Daphnia pulex TaxID=6669 RepID=UPI001EDFE625|nr:F-box only protein 21-like isoform X1 [Daphnia pulex]